MAKQPGNQPGRHRFTRGIQVKITITILFFICGAHAFAFFPMTNEINGTIEWSSYGSPQFSAPSYVLGTEYYKSYFQLGNPAFTNHLYSPGHSGATWQTIYQSDWEMSEILLWYNFKVPGYDWILSTDNGGYGSNSVVQWGTNLFSFPPLSWDGSSAGNEGLSIAGISHVALGCIPDATDPPASLAWQRNTASTNLNGLYGAPIIDLNGILRANGWWTNSLVGFYAGGHPYPAGSLIMAMEMLLAQNVETNIGAVAFDWQAASASTNHCAVTGLTVSGNTLSCTIHFDRMPMAWDVPDGTITNDARDAFTVAPVLGNAFQWTIQVTNLPVGSCSIILDGSNIVTLSSSALAAGYNLFTNYNGSQWAQRKETLNRNFDQIGCDRVTRIAHSAGQALSLNAISGKADMVNLGGNASQQYVTNGKRGTNYTAAMQTWIDQVQTNYDVAIHNAAVQTNHTLSIVIQQPVFAPVHR